MCAFVEAQVHMNVFYKLLEFVDLGLYVVIDVHEDVVLQVAVM